MSSKTMMQGLLAAILASAVAVRADVFNMPSGQTSLQFVTVGDAGNAADPSTGFGAVGHIYQMGKYDVTLSQYAAFLNAVAASDPYGLYNYGLGNDYYNYRGLKLGISRSGSSGSYSYSVMGNGNVPATNINWGEAARFCNWLQNGQPTGAEGNGTTETGAYAMGGATTDAALMAVTRGPSATYFIPTEDEWYKAAYYKGGGLNAGYWFYPTQSNNPPSNVLSATGTNNANFNSYTSSSGTGTSNTYSGGTFVSAGTLALISRTALRDGSSLAVGAGAKALLGFSSGLPAVEEAISGAGAAPEPGTLSLLLAAVLGGAAGLRAHRRLPRPTRDVESVT